MYRRGLFALSADPVHLGHLDIIRQAAEQCTTLVVYVSNNDEKRSSYLFSSNARRRLVKGDIGDRLPNVEVVQGEMPLTDMFLEQGCDVLFRGVRAVADAEYEKKQLAFHERILPGITDKTVMLQASASLAHISSSTVKAFAFHHLDVSTMVTPRVKVALEAVLHEQVIVGITGGMGMGKTYVAEEICKGFAARKVDATHLNFDALLRTLYAQDTPGAQLVRDEVASIFPGVLSDDRKSVDLGKLKAALVDADPDLVQRIHDITKPHVFRLFRAQLRGKKGLILVEWAQLLEDLMLPLVNNRVVVVDSPDRDALLVRRGVPLDLFMKLDAQQWTTERKVEAAEQEIRMAGYGKVFLYTNRLGQPFNDTICDQLAALLPRKSP